MSNAPIRLGSPRTKFEAIDGTGATVAWEMDLVAVIAALETANKEREVPGADPYGHLAKVIELVQDDGGPLLTMQQADEFADACWEAYSAIKKKRTERMATFTAPTPTLPPSTESTPSP